jgi:hypothetical protein
LLLCHSWRGVLGPTLRLPTIARSTPPRFRLATSTIRGNCGWKLVVGTCLLIYCRQSNPNARLAKASGLWVRVIVSVGPVAASRVWSGQGDNPVDWIQSLANAYSYHRRYHLLNSLRFHIPNLKHSLRPANWTDNDLPTGLPFASGSVPPGQLPSCRRYAICILTDYVR